MISLLLEHHTIKTSRRALIVSSFFTLLLPGITISGDGLNILGLIFDVEKHQMLGTMRLVSLYFFWIFLWLIIFKTSQKTHINIETFYLNLIDKKRKEAENIDSEPRELVEWNPDIEPWWEFFHELVEKFKKQQAFFQSAIYLITILAIGAIEYFPPVIIGFCAIFYPTAVHDWMFSFFVIVSQP